MDLSIIVPAYNVATYIEKCIRSLENQDIPKNDYEIIVTNDGSPDNCKEIVEDLQKEFSNIVLINQENQGVSMARNNAIAIAKGTYILPIDPDDYVVSNTFKRVLERVKKQNLDALYLGYEFFDEYGNSYWVTNFSDKEIKVYTGFESYFLARGKGVQDPDRSVAIIYKKSFIEKFKIKYPKNVPYLEDGVFIGKFFAVAQNVGFDNETFYQRTTRPGSATNSNLFFLKISSDGFLNAIKDLTVFRNKYEKEKLSIALLNQLHAKFFLHALAPSATNFSIKTYRNITASIKNKSLELKSTVGLSTIFKRLILIFNFSKWLFFIYYPVYMKVKSKKYN